MVVWRSPRPQHWYQSESLTRFSLFKCRRVANPKQKNPASSTSIWAMHGSVLKGASMPIACELHWKASFDDFATNWHEDLDRGRYNRSSTWLYGTECDGANGSRGESVFRTRFR